MIIHPLSFLKVTFSCRRGVVGALNSLPLTRFGMMTTPHLFCTQSERRCGNEEQNALPCNTVSRPFWLPLSPPQSQPFWGPQLPERAHLARGACLGSCPCLHGEPELMVLKWRPDGDRGLIAAECGGGGSCVPAHSCCPATLAKAASLYLLPSYHQATTPVSSLPPLSGTAHSHHCASL